jgi:hypothetical protein
VRIARTVRRELQGAGIDVASTTVEVSRVPALVLQDARGRASPVGEAARGSQR